MSRLRSLLGLSQSSLCRIGRFAFGCRVIGGLFDLRYLFRHLRRHTPDPTDNGRVG